MKKISKEEAEKRILEKYNGTVEMISPYISRGNSITLKCKDCGEEWTVSGHRAIDGETSCPNCKRNIKKLYSIYELMFPNGKRYIGMTSKKVERRWDKGRGYITQPVYKDICYFGWDNITHNVLYSGLTFLEAEKKEQYLIQYYNTQDPQFGYNVEAGGFNGRIGKASQSMVAQYSLEGQLLKIFKSVLDAEIETKVRYSNICMCAGGKTKSAGGYIWKFNKDEKDFLEQVPPYNIHNKNGKAKKVAQIYEGKVIKIWDSQTEAAIAINRTKSSLNNALKNKGKCAGYNWKYVEEE